MTPSFSPDGRSIAYFGHNVRGGAWGYNIHLWIKNLQDDRNFDVVQGWDYTAGAQVMSDVADLYAPPPAHWSQDGAKIYFQGTVRGRSDVFVVSADGGQPTAIAGGDHGIMLASIDPACQHIAALIGDDRTPGDLYFGSIGEELRRLTDLNSDVLSQIYTTSAKRFTYSGGGGRQVDGFLMIPPRYDPQKSYPLVLELFPSFVHGRAFNFEFQMLAGQGYVVFYTNPLGATSYGEEFLAGSFVRGAYFADYPDLMAGLDHVIATGGIDAGHLGVTGDAYGGSLTNWLITQTDRFTASIARRSGVNQWLDAGDRNDARREALPDHYSPVFCGLSRSPISFVPQVESAHLMIQSVGDCRDPTSEVEPFFIALRALGKVARLAVFQNSTHFLARMGIPSHRVEYFRLISEWFEMHLGGAI